MLAVPRFIALSLCSLACIDTRAATLSESADDELASSFGDAATISIATGSQKPLRLAPAVASVISAADIKAMGALDLDQVLETELAWQPAPSLRLMGNYSFQRNIDKATNTDAGYAPHHHVFARADYNFASDWFVSPQLNWVAARNLFNTDAREPSLAPGSIYFDLPLPRRSFELQASYRL
jgi:outer membrane receptor for ferrienterochelin and colicin